MFAITPVVLLILALTTGTAATIGAHLDSATPETEAGEARHGEAFESGPNKCPPLSDPAASVAETPAEGRAACLPQFVVSE